MTTTEEALFQVESNLPPVKPWKTVEAPERNYKGEGEAQPFPNYARTNDPTVLELWHEHEKEFGKFYKHTVEVLKLMTGNPELSRVWWQGSRDTDLSVTGVPFSQIAEAHRGWWKKPKSGVTSPYKKHSLYGHYAALTYKAPSFGEAPTFMWGDGYMGRPSFFEHDGYLYFGTSITGYTAKDYPWYKGVSPWEPLKRWEWEKAKDEVQENKK